MQRAAVSLQHGRECPFTRAEEPALPLGLTTTASYDSVGQMVTLTSPDAGQTQWRHYVNGLLAGGWNSAASINSCQIAP